MGIAPEPAALADNDHACAIHLIIRWSRWSMASQMDMDMPREDMPREDVLGIIADIHSLKSCILSTECRVRRAPPSKPKNYVESLELGRRITNNTVITGTPTLGSPRAVPRHLNSDPGDPQPRDTDCIQHPRYISARPDQDGEIVLDDNDMSLAR
ncbi:hypothetical protein B0H11DRAFT_329193 [Mycena galericulata]|nr:hypothetical protein B0H11DRAFT_329193 [Mycena galericulata]